MSHLRELYFFPRFPQTIEQSLCNTPRFPREVIHWFIWYMDSKEGFSMLWDIHLTKSLTKFIFTGQLLSSLRKYGSHDLRQDAHLFRISGSIFPDIVILWEIVHHISYYESIRSAHPMRKLFPTDFILLVQSSWLNCCHDVELEAALIVVLGGSFTLLVLRLMQYDSVKLWCHVWELEKSRSSKEESRSLHQERGVKTRRKCVMSLISTTCINLYLPS